MKYTKDEFFLVVQDGKFYIEGFDSEAKYNFFALFDLDQYEQEMQLAKKLSHPKSGKFALRHFTDAERANMFNTKLSELDDYWAIQWLNDALVLDPEEYKKIFRPVVILEGCFFHNSG